MAKLNRIIDLTYDQWQSLERLAGELNCVPTRGPQTEQPSWRALIRQIADGELKVTRRRRRKKGTTA